jgi:hypothetical protein
MCHKFGYLAEILSHLYDGIVRVRNKIGEPRLNKVFARVIKKSDGRFPKTPGSPKINDMFCLFFPEITILRLNDSM